MIFNAYYPILEFFGYWLMRFAFRLHDRGFSFSGKSTKSKTIHGYINIYAGPVYLMHYKYSTILNVCFVTLMYGFGLPVLYPVAIFAFVILYFVEKSMLYYSYRMPPMYDAKMSEMVYRIL
jgi:hypothetical protein